MNQRLQIDVKALFNVFIALIIGFVFGSFIRNTMLNNEIIYASAYNYDDTVYILQTGIYYDEANARSALNDLIKLGINGIIVKERNQYYLYHQIAVKQSDLNPLINQLDELKINYFVKERLLFDMISQFDPKSADYKFYFQSISYYLSILNNKQITFSKDYLDHISEVDLELYYNLSAYNENYTTNVSSMYALYVYKSFIDLLY